MLKLLLYNGTLIKYQQGADMKLGEWEVFFSDQVKKWLDNLEDEKAVRIAEEIQLLSNLGNMVRPPHSKALGDGLFELRERRFGMRVYYCFHGKKCIILLLAGDKQSQKRDIQNARKQKEELK